MKWVCEWQYNDYLEHWKTTCGNDYSFIEGGPEENGMKFCPYCGKPLVLAITGKESDK